AATGGRSTSKTWLVVSMIVLGAGAMALVAGLGFGFLTGGPSDAPFGGVSVDSTAAASFVGSETCAGCHRAQADLWRSSPHKRAMDHATEKSVLGDFKDVSFAYNGVRSRFFRQDRKYLVETDGPDGKLAVFEIKYTFGVDPLQQYLIEFPDGRLQA